MYALLKSERNNEYYVGNPRTRNSRKVQVIASCGDYVALSEVSRNLNHNVPEVLVERVVDPQLDKARLTAKALTQSTCRKLDSHHKFPGARKKRCDSDTSTKAIEKPNLSDSSDGIVIMGNTTNVLPDSTTGHINRVLVNHCVEKISKTRCQLATVPMIKLRKISIPSDSIDDEDLCRPRHTESPKTIGLLRISEECKSNRAQTDRSVPEKEKKSGSINVNPDDTSKGKNDKELESTDRSDREILVLPTIESLTTNVLVQLTVDKDDSVIKLSKQDQNNPDQSENKELRIPIIKSLHSSKTESIGVCIDENGNENPSRGSMKLNTGITKSIHIRDDVRINRNIRVIKNIPSTLMIESLSTHEECKSPTYAESTEMKGRDKSRGYNVRLLAEDRVNVLTPALSILPSPGTRSKESDSGIQPFQKSDINLKIYDGKSLLDACKSEVQLHSEKCLNVEDVVAFESNSEVNQSGQQSASSRETECEKISLMQSNIVSQFDPTTLISESLLTHEKCKSPTNDQSIGVKAQNELKGKNFGQSAKDRVDVLTPFLSAFVSPSTCSGESDGEMQAFQKSDINSKIWDGKSLLDACNSKVQLHSEKCVNAEDVVAFESNSKVNQSGQQSARSRETECEKISLMQSNIVSQFDPTTLISESLLTHEKCKSPTNDQSIGVEAQNELKGKNFGQSAKDRVDVLTPVLPVFLSPSTCSGESDGEIQAFQKSDINSKIWDGKSLLDACNSEAQLHSEKCVNNNDPVESKTISKENHNKQQSAINLGIEGGNMSPTQSSVVTQFDLISADSWKNSLSASSEMNTSVFMESAALNDTSLVLLTAADDAASNLGFSMEPDQEWLPLEVEYEMNPLLQQLLDDEVDEEDEETNKVNLRTPGIADGERETLRTCSTSNVNVSLPNLSDDSYNDGQKGFRKKGNRMAAREIETEESNDDSDADKDYIPSDGMNGSEDSDDEMCNNNVSGPRKKSVSLSKSANSSANISGVLNISDKAAIGSCDNTDLTVQTSDKPKKEKKYLCIYCKKMYHKLPRHLEDVHSEVADVKKFMDLDKGNSERRELLDILRNTGTFQYNTDVKYNKGDIIPSRRPNPKYKKKGSDYKTCAKCLGTYSSLNIRHHAARCVKNRIKTQRSVIVLGKAVEGRLHKDASTKLRLEVFPPLKEDNVIRLIRYDRILIIWGNKLCLRYVPHYQHNMIRARLRLMGRLLLSAKEINPNVTDFASLYNPKMYDDVIRAARIVGRYDERIGEFGAPSVGMNLGTYLKQIGEILANEYVKLDEPEKERKVEQFLKVLKVDFALDINKAALETQRKHQRQRKVVLPSTDDIRTLITYLNTEMERSFNTLSEMFSFEKWFELSELTMAAIVTFNRRRTGEIQNILVEDYQNQEKIDEKTDKELYVSLSVESKAVANKYVRISIRGKKNRTVAVLLYPQLVKNLNLILKYRTEAKVPANNKYLFGLPSSNKKRIKVVDACEAMRKFSILCGASKPETLRGTQLRKHIATQCVMLNLKDNEVSDLANFMGHAEKIHKDVYRQPIKSREILGISRLLEAAQGDDAESDDYDDCDGSDAEVTSENNKINRSEPSMQEIVECEDQLPRAEEEAEEKEAETSGTVDTSADESLEPRKQGVKRRATSDDSFQSPKPQKYKNQSSAKSTQKSSTSKKNKKSTDESTQKAVKRAWSLAEKAIVTKAFAVHMKERRLPSFVEITKLKIQYPEVLAGRTLPQIKTWVNNQNKSAGKRVTSPVKGKQKHQYTKKYKD